MLAHFLLLLLNPLERERGEGEREGGGEEQKAGSLDALCLPRFRVPTALFGADG